MGRLWESIRTTLTSWGPLASHAISRDAILLAWRRLGDSEDLKWWSARRSRVGVAMEEPSILSHMEESDVWVVMRGWGGGTVGQKDFF